MRSGSTVRESQSKCLLLNAVQSGVCSWITIPGSTMNLDRARSIVSGVVRSLILEENL